MPFKSQKQRAWMHVNKPAMAARWEKEGGSAPVAGKETPKKPLPKKVAPKKKR